MPPRMKLSTSPSTTNHSPNTSAVARVRSVRGARPRATSTRTSATSAACSNQEISNPISPLNSR